MGLEWIHRSAFLLAGGLVLWAPAEVRGDPEPEPFEVIVLRGAQVSRVTGTRSGAIREEVLLEAPRPAEPEPEAEPEAEPAPREPDARPPPSVVVYVVPESITGYPIVVGDDRVRDRDFRRDGHKPYRVWTRARSSQRIHHLGSRGGHAGRRDRHRP